MPITKLLHGTRCQNDGFILELNADGMSKIVFIIALLALCSCRNDEFGEVNNEITGSVDTTKEHVFVVCEGLYGSGTGDISLIDPENNSVTNNLFYSVNGFPAGDVAISLSFVDDFLYLVVNNSGKVIKLNGTSFQEVSSISNLVSPRYILPIGPNKLYVSIFNSQSIKVIDTQSLSISQSIHTGRSIEKMQRIGNEVWCANWSEYNSSLTNNVLLVIDSETDILVDSVIVGKEPNSLLLDSQNHLWVLCSGGYNHEEAARLICIDPSSRGIIQDFVFPVGSYPSRLCINSAGDKLFWIDTDIFQMQVNASELPEIPLIHDSGRLFYGLAIDPENDDIWATNAMDYMQSGFALRFSNIGLVLDSFQLGIIPGEIYFK